MATDNQTPLFSEQHATVLRVDDFPNMVGWYTETLGLPIAKMMPEASLAVLSLPGPSYLCLYGSTEEHAYTTPSEPKCLINWRTDDINATRERLLELGVLCNDIVGSDGFRLFRFFDPEGTPHDCCWYDERWLGEKS